MLNAAVAIQIMIDCVNLAEECKEGRVVAIEIRQNSNASLKAFVLQGPTCIIFRREHDDPLAVCPNPHYLKSKKKTQWQA